MIDIQISMPDGSITRVRKVSPVATRRGAEQYEREVREAILAGARSSKEDELSTPLRQVLTGLASVVAGLAAVRSTAGDAHGRLLRTHEHHARVAVNAAKTLTVFMLDTFKYQRGKTEA